MGKYIPNGHKINQTALKCQVSIVDATFIYSKAFKHIPIMDFMDFMDFGFANLPSGNPA
jgi:hypothetical protein